MACELVARRAQIAGGEADVRYKQAIRVAYVAGTFALVAALSVPATAAIQHSSFTNTAGVSYPSAFSPAIWNFHNHPVGGSITDGTTANSNQYTAKVVCVAFRSGHRVYWGAQITSGVKPNGDGFVFWYAKAGGSGVGQLAGEPYATKTCYNGSNGGLAGPIMTITGGLISVS